MTDYYSLLGIPRFTASEETIKNAYIEQIQFFHPDRGNVDETIAHERTQALNEAYGVLKDKSKKEQYDASLREYLKNNIPPDYEYVKNAYDIFRNTVPRYSYEKAQSSTMESRYYNPSRQSPSTKPTSKSSGSGGVGCLVWIVVILVIFFVTRGNGDTEKEVTPTIEYDPVPVTNGQMFKAPTGDCPCEFVVETREGSNYYIYMDDVYGNNDISFYVKGGNTVTKDIPLGTYKLYYCSGETWYGVNHKFGSSTVASTSDDLFEFTSSISGNYIYYTSWTVTLYRVQGGNMDTERIDLVDFPD